MATAIENTAPAHLIDPTTGYPAPTLGSAIGANGANLVAFTGQKAAGEGSYAYGIGIFVRGGNHLHPYVVWRLILLPTGEWIVEAGDYCLTLTEALVRYTARGGVAT